MVKVSSTANSSLELSLAAMVRYPEGGVQSSTAFFEFTYGEGSGLERASEGTGLHGEMHCGMKCQGIVSGNLLLDGPFKGTGEFLP